MATTGPTKADSGAAVIDAEGLLFAANVLLNSLWGKIHSGSRTHEEAPRRGQGAGDGAVTAL